MTFGQQNHISTLNIWDKLCGLIKSSGKAHWQNRVITYDNSTFIFRIRSKLFRDKKSVWKYILHRTKYNSFDRFIFINRESQANSPPFGSVMFISFCIFVALDVRYIFLSLVSLLSVSCSVCPNEGGCVITTRPKKACGRYDEAGWGRVSVIAFCMRSVCVWMCWWKDIVCVCVCASIHFSYALFQLNFYITFPSVMVLWAETHTLPYTHTHTHIHTHTHTQTQVHCLSLLWPLFSSLCPLRRTHRCTNHTHTQMVLDKSMQHLCLYASMYLLIIHLLCLINRKRSLPGSPYISVIMCLPIDFRLLCFTWFRSTLYP